MNKIKKEKRKIELLLTELPKVSLNKFFARSHWSKRNKLNDDYALIVRSQTKQKFTNPCNVFYLFTFRNAPLDCSNCVAMVKMIEDCLFEDDSTKVVKSINVTSLKGKSDSVKITVV
ncbi:MAG: hypothetical protein A2W11_03760 [Ignavibacteria bacterium RBG_16_35_7]|nr:MAG: hypothetical protein A2W11_03760 [Ignavibacteria bacterium RBG_16_35_7]